MKSWRVDIENHIRHWSASLGNLGWWPKFVYHFTDVLNAVSILETGCLYSRSEASRLGLMQSENASPEIIQSTRPEHLQYVRLYFRPRTPTQYRNEGIRPKNQRELGGAHCAIPVFFCLDSLPVLALDNSEFSNGNMGSTRARHSSGRDFFRQIPFDRVFHSGWLSEDEKEDIVFRRNAEVLVPQELPLRPYLKRIVCRSAAERQTLLHLLSNEARRKWNSIITLSDHGFFERKWTYVEEVVTVDNIVIFRFNPSTSTPGPFQVIVTYCEKNDSSNKQWQGEIESLSNTFRLKISNAYLGECKLFLDGSLAFADNIIFDEIPF
jgi:hypothetical protein